MPTPEEKYYDAMNTLLAPVRAAKSLVQTVLLLLIFIGLGIAYPLIQLCNGEPLTLFSFLVPVMTILGVIDLFYVPIYTILTGIACAVVFFSPAFASGDTPGEDFVGVALTGTQRALIFIAVLVFGILQKYVRNRIYEKAKRRTQLLNEIHQERVEAARKDGLDYDSLPPR